MKINNSKNNNNNNKNMFSHKVRQWYWTSVSATLIKSNIHIGNHKNEIKCFQLEFHFKNILLYFHFMFVRSIVFNFFFVALILMVTNTCVSFIRNGLKKHEGYFTCCWYVCTEICSEDERVKNILRNFVVCDWLTI